MTAGRRVLLFAGPPGAWMGHLLLSYFFVAPTCGGSAIPLHLTTVVLAAAEVTAVVVGLRGLRRGRGAALALGGLFLLAIVLQGAANAMVDPCA